MSRRRLGDGRDRRSRRWLGRCHQRLGPQIPLTPARLETGIGELPTATLRIEDRPRELEVGLGRHRASRLAVGRGEVPEHFGDRQLVLPGLLANP